MANDRLVVDSGYILEAILPTTRADQDNANALIHALSRGDLKAVVPWIFYPEIASGCAKAVRGRRVESQVAVEFMDELIYLGIDIDMKIDPPSVTFSEAMRTGAQAYDAMYVVLAEAMGGLPVATVDRGMRTAVRSMKLQLFNADSVR